MATILIVDDHHSTCTLLGKLVSLHGHRSVCCESGSEALAYLERNAADLVILDMMMPGMSGIEVLRTLRHDGRHQSLPVLAYSAASEFQDEAIREGAQEYLLKGQFAWAPLRSALDKYLASGVQ